MPIPPTEFRRLDQPGSTGWDCEPEGRESSLAREGKGRKQGWLLGGSSTGSRHWIGAFEDGGYWHFLGPT